MLVDTIDWEISQTDPKKTIQVGSFRIMPDGSQKLSEVCICPPQYVYALHDANHMW